MDYLEKIEILKPQRINCNKCKNFYITWDGRFPYGCHAIGFKGKEMPSVSVRNNTGIDCQFFEERVVKK